MVMDAAEPCGYKTAKNAPRFGIGGIMNKTKYESMKSSDISFYVFPLNNSLFRSSFFRLNCNHEA